MIQAVYGRRATLALELMANRKDLQGNTIEYEYHPPRTDIIRVTIWGKNTLWTLDAIRNNNVLYMDWTPLHLGLYYLSVRILTLEGVRFWADLPEPINVIRWHQIPEGEEVERNLAFQLKLKRY